MGHLLTTVVSCQLSVAGDQMMAYRHNDQRIAICYTQSLVNSNALTLMAFLKFCHRGTENNFFSKDATEAQRHREMQKINLLFICICASVAEILYLGFLCVSVSLRLKFCI
jgi:hypothetical protein